MKDIILEGIVYTIMGILIVFAMLVIIMLVIKAMQLFSGQEKPVKAEKVEEVQPQVQNVPVPKAQNSDNELIAVITAAITAAMGKSASGFIVRSYKKISGNEWNKAGRREILENRF